MAKNLFRSIGLVSAVALVPAATAALAALAIFTSGAIGVYHAGVEAGIFEGLTTCSAALSGGSSADILADIMATPLVRCDQIQWSFLGVSMAGWNAILSIGSASVISWLSLRRPRAQA